MGRGYVVGVDAGGTKVAFGLFDANHRLVDRLQYPTDIQIDGPGFADGLIASAHRLIERNALSMQDIDGIGVCMPSFILFDKGYVCMTSAMTNIRDFAMRDYIEERLATRIVLDNDSNCAALAEHRFGAGKGSRHMVYISASTGLGSGIIIEGNLFRGSYGWAGECGHMLATPDEGVLCGCRNQGCYMSYSSGRYASVHAKAKLDEGRESALRDCGEIAGEALLAAYLNGDALADEIIHQMAHNIGVCLFNVYQMLNINVFVIGGGLVNFGEHLFGKVRAVFDRYNHIPMPVEFRFAELGQDFGIIGAAELIRASM